MARITLTIEAEDARDLRDSLWDMANQYDQPETTAVDYVARYGREVEATTEAPDAGATQDAEPGERQARKRRTKAEIAEDNARAAAGGSTAAPATPASGVGTATGSPSTSAATASKDVFGDQLKEVVAEGGLTHDDVAAAGREAFEKIGAPRTQAILLDLGGTKAFKSIPADKLAAVHAAFLAAIAEG